MGGRSWRWCALSLALLVACGSGAGHSGGAAADGSNGSTGSPPPSPGSPASASTPSAAPERCNGTASVRLKGVRPGLVSSATIGLGSFSGDLVAGDLALGSIALPGSGQVTLTLPIDSMKVTNGQGTREVTTCAAPLAFTFDAADVDPLRCHIVIELDLGRSLRPDPETGAPLLVPQSSLHF